MAGIKLSVGEVVRKTREILGDKVDLSYITEEVVARDAASSDNAEIKAPLREGVQSWTWYGNNARYGTRTINGVNRSVYYFDYAGGDVTNIGNACGSKVNDAWVDMEYWHHSYLGTCPNGREKWSFSQ